ncbi:hypothetical protein CRG98_018598 [Punica granatum]|uniref:Uncharacterized protein n=1 Tax=Punica granatum TaxID=22663 RepID=A0A2I0K001_PUNGR|nr:hypothetical protein CRG98_018598 [Punica granatum]
MAADMAELMALLKGPNRASSNSTPPPGYEPTVDPNPWVPPTHAPEAPPPMVFPVPNLHAPVYTSKPLTFQAPQPHINFSYPAPPPVNIPVSEPNTPTQAAFAAPLTNCLLETEVEQEQRLKKMEENIKALQSGGSRLDAGDGDWILFPGMRLPPKIKVPEFQRYHGTTDPRHHLRHYRGKMLQYWDYEEFVIHTFWDSLAGAALDCTMEMADDQSFEAYAVKWRARAAKHVPPISEAQQIQLFHSTLTGAYYLHLLAHTSSFSSLIDAGKKLDIGIKLGKIEGPTGKERQDASVNAVSLGRQTPMPYQQQYPAPPINYSALLAYPPPRAPQPYGYNYATTSHWASPNGPLALGAPPTAQQAPTLQPRQGGQARPRLQYPPLPIPQSQEMIEKNQLSFNEVKPPNVQANPLPDHESNSDAAINLIGICPSGKDKVEEEKLIFP